MSRARLVEAAFELADADGLDALIIRAVATPLGAKPMSLYRHVANKDELLNVLVERMYAEFETPDPQHPDWWTELRRRANSVREVLVRHPWSIALIETRTGPDRPFAFTHAEAVLATLISAGCSPRVASRVFVVLDSYAYGFAMQEVTMPSNDPSEVATDDFVAAMHQYPSLVALMGAVMADADYDFTAEFDAGSTSSSTASTADETHAPKRHDRPKAGATHPPTHAADEAANWRGAEREAPSRGLQATICALTPLALPSCLTRDARSVACAIGVRAGRSHALCWR